VPEFAVDVDLLVACVGVLEEGPEGPGALVVRRAARLVDAVVAGSAGVEVDRSVAPGHVGAHPPRLVVGRVGKGPEDEVGLRLQVRIAVSPERHGGLPLNRGPRFGGHIHIRGSLEIQGAAVVPGDPEGIGDGAVVPLAGAVLGDLAGPIVELPPAHQSGIGHARQGQPHQENQGHQCTEFSVHGNPPSSRTNKPHHICASATCRNGVSPQIVPACESMETCAFTSFP